jgi:hypothetical protein
MSLNLLATATASIKRAAISAGKRGAPVTVLDGLACTPLYPADAGAVNNLLLRLKSETPYRILETFVLGRPDIQGGDTLVIGGDEYTVRAVAAWTLPGASREFTHLMVEELPRP